VREYNIEPIGFRRMIVLSLDTTGRAGSAAIVDRDALLAEVSGDPAATHGQRLPGELMQLLNRAGIRVGAVDLLAVAAGPGSFTGLRVGIAAMQGLAMAIGKPIVPVSTFEALARAGSQDWESLVAPWIDAQRGEIFGALYDTDGRTPIGEPTALSPASTLAWIGTVAAGRRLRFVGDGAARYADGIAAALGVRAQVVPVVPRLARWIATIALEAPERAVAPHAVAPIYVRRPDAELARDRRAREV
jgi:tRNA threonylcarbamoyladenosine biosynthesis protein TsaB